MFSTNTTTHTHTHTHKINLGSKEVLHKHVCVHYMHIMETILIQFYDNSHNKQCMYIMQYTYIVNTAYKYIMYVQCLL